jgi:CheY-like chemotaxis protein
MKVLIIDDDEAMIGIWSTVLKKESIEVLTAGSGKLGIELAQKNIPDFILLDQIITDMKGNDVLKELKSNPTTAPIPVALVSNYSEPEMMHEAIESGAVDYILKYQIDPSDLANKIKTLLHGTKPLNPGETTTQPQSMPADPTMTPPAAVPDPTPVVPQPQVIDPTIPQPQVIQPGQPLPGQPVPMQPSSPASPAPVVPQPQVIDPNKPTQ